MLLLMGASSSLGAANAGGTQPNPDDIRVSQQTGTCTGVVKDPAGETVIGASVVVKGTTNGTITGIDGDFSLPNVKKGDVIQVSYIGFQTVEVVYEGQPLNVTLSEDSQMLGEVVVTALGIKREKKSLGYAMQEVKGESLVNARETNLANALSGKIAGVQVIRSSNGPGGSSKIQLRGANSVTGTNQPLIVVDGVPMDNFTGADNADFWNPSLDMGNGLSDINPEDIESMSVLKGASAAALYGSRAGNGVILITTKKGVKKEGLGITISASVSAETIFMRPEMQTAFGQGANGEYNSESSDSWGPAMGTEYMWNGQSRRMQYYDNLDAYFRTGTNFTESISFSQMFGKTAIYASATRMDDASKIPDANLDRTNFMLRASSTFGKDDRWSFDAKVQYIRTGAENRPMTGQNDSNRFLTIYNLPTSVNILDYKNPLTDAGTMNWWSPSGLNPYWLDKYNLNADRRNRFLLNASLKYKFTDWLDLEVRGGSDMYYTELTGKTYAGASNLNNGNSAYELSEQRFFENNFSFLFTARKDNLIDKLGGNLTFGGNLMQRKSSGLKNRASRLTVPNLFSINNSSNSDRSVTETYSEKKINSLYGTIGLNYDSWIFLDATFRNDWTSTLSKDNRSFFYPSVSLSWVFSDMMSKINKPLPEWITYLKARASYAQVGNDMDPYQLYDVYSIGSDPFGNTIATPGSTKYDSTVRNELIGSWEAGVEMRFFNNRLGFDFAWYKSNAKYQLMNIPMNQMSGYANKKINAGNIQNTGVELMVTARPVETEEFSWDTQINFSKNNNKVKELVDGMDMFELEKAPWLNVQVAAMVGEDFGAIVGPDFVRNENGDILIDPATGLPKYDNSNHVLGNASWDWTGGLSTTIGYKNLTLSALFDVKVGADLFSMSARASYESGKALETIEGRDAWYVSEEQRQAAGLPKGSADWTPTGGFIAPGPSMFIYDNSYIKCREITLSYRLPDRWFKEKIDGITVSFVARNPFIVWKNIPNIDPDSNYNNTTGMGLEYGSLPSRRSFGFNLNVKF